MRVFGKKVALVLACLVAGAGIARGETIKVGAGAGAPTENVLKPVKAAFEKATGLELSIISAGVKIAFRDVASGVIDAGAAGLAYDDWLAFMKKEGEEVKDPTAFTPVKIGTDRIAVFVSKENTVAKLSKEQLQKIFAGEIENWKDVGGMDSPILVAIGGLAQGTNNTFAKHVMAGKPFLKDILNLTSSKEVLEAVAVNPAAIGFGPAGVVDSSVNVPEIPEISRDITLITKGKPSAKVQKLIDFILGDGKKYTRQ
jgi:phosphate transport system substrate-binding protein